MSYLAFLLPCIRFIHFYVGPYVAGAFLKPLAHIYSRALRHNRRICPIRSAPRLSSDALIMGVAGGNSARQHCHRGSAAFIVEIIIYGIGVARQGRGRLIPERARRKRVAGRNVSKAAARYRVSRDAISRVAISIRDAFSKPPFPRGILAGNFRDQPGAVPLIYIVIQGV